LFCEAFLLILIKIIIKTRLLPLRSKGSKGKKQNNRRQQGKGKKILIKIRTRGRSKGEKVAIFVFLKACLAGKGIKTKIATSKSLRSFKKKFFFCSSPLRGR
jgi:hypothetical protein